jgi:hypothetical protein
MAARSPGCGVSARLSGVNVAGDWTARMPFVSVNRTERSNWDATAGGEGGGGGVERGRKREMKQ